MFGLGDRNAIVSTILMYKSFRAVGLGTKPSLPVYRDLCMSLHRY